MMRLPSAPHAHRASIDVTGSDEACIGTGNDRVEICNASGSLEKGAGDELLEFDGAMDAVDPEAGADAMVLLLQGDGSFGSTHGGRL